ncbi:MAG: redoxin domain-containing protein [Proteobacteria bacterium]|nr:MAG: redoxin domain-containing protein [Pseudomonadota bacterium]
MKILSTFLLMLTFGSNTIALSAELKANQPAPQFETTDVDGKAVKLADFKGKWVVLEWFNKGCPFVQKHYNSKNMQSLQKTYTKKGVIWITINSTNPEHKNFVTAAQAKTDAVDLGAFSTHIVMDPKGEIGNKYGAMTTPHMFVINPDQKVSYLGAIDANNSIHDKNIASTKNYVANALDQGMEGKPIDLAYAKPYGCSVKYK